MNQLKEMKKENGLLPKLVFLLKLMLSFKDVQIWVIFVKVNYNLLKEVKTLKFQSLEAWKDKKLLLIWTKLNNLSKRTCKESKDLTSIIFLILMLLNGKMIINSSNQTWKSSSIVSKIVLSNTLLKLLKLFNKELSSSKLSTHLLNVMLSNNTFKTKQELFINFSLLKWIKPSMNMNLWAKKVRKRPV